MMMDDKAIYSHYEMKQIEKELTALLNKPLLDGDLEAAVLIDFKIAEGHLTRRRFLRKPEMIPGQYIESLTIRSSAKEDDIVHTSIPMCSYYGVQRLRDMRQEFKFIESSLNELGYEITKLKK
jgi:hypothetical protein